MLLFEDLEFLGNDTRSVSVQLVTFNGNERTAYGFIFINFKFSDGERRVSVQKNDPRDMSNIGASWHHVV